MDLRGAQSERQIAQLLSFATALNLNRRDGLVRPKPRVPPLKNRQDRQPESHPNRGARFDRRKQTRQCEHEYRKKKVTPASLPNREHKRGREQNHNERRKRRPPAKYEPK